MRKLFRRKRSYTKVEIPTIENFKLPPSDDIYLIGNGPSLNETPYEKLENAFTIGTNRSWLWGECSILMWRDSRITEELQFFGTPKGNSIWLSGEPAFTGTALPISEETKALVDYQFSDSWKDTYIGDGIKWNGIIFHALAVAKHINPTARIHLLGVDLGVQSDIHHFFNIYRGFDRGFYKSSWEPQNFNYQKRLDMMVKNFELLKKRGFDIINHSKESRLTDIFGYDQL